VTLYRTFGARVLIGAALISFAGAACAHAHLKDAVPAEGSTVKASPDHIVLTFSEAAKLTALTIQKDGEAEQKLAPLPKEESAQLSVVVPKLSPGKYVVNWRVVSDDTHIMSGKLHFTVADPAASSTPSH
jgi:methionine-rich copper-binding protein CopC